MTHPTPPLPDGRRLILASTSPFRRELLTRLGLPFETRAPDIEETPLPGESGVELAKRLAERKAQAVAVLAEDALVIGSDQVPELDGRHLGKPGDHPKALAQLQGAAGRTVHFYTGLCLVDTRSGHTQRDVVPFRVTLRPLSEAQIRGYLAKEPAFNCAGGFKAEGLGSALFQRLEGEDPTALIGLPLIRLVAMLEAVGVDVLTA